MRKLLVVIIGLVPGEGHEHEGPAFHDCGMHYVDIARWYAESAVAIFINKN